ncbi:MAG: hypothetical protein AB1601_03775 [Planctomycetota bacterium]
MLMWFALLGLPTYLGATAYLVIRWSAVTATAPQLIFTYVALTWPWVGAVGLWYYEKRVIPDFSAHVAGVLSGSPDYMPGLSRSTRNAVVFLWAALVVVAYLLSHQFVTHRFAFQGWSDPWYIVSCLAVTIWAILTGTGFTGVLNTGAVVQNACKRHTFVIDPYHPDNVGGLGAFGSLTIRTTMLFSSGALYVPILTLTATELGPYIGAGAWALVILFSLFIGWSFLVPNYTVFATARRALAAQVAGAHKQLAALAEVILKGHPSDQQHTAFANVHTLYKDLRETQIFPFDPATLAKLVSAVLLPIFMLLLEKAVSRLTG